MSLGTRIRQARQLAGKTQRALADHFHIKGAAVAQWESGDTRPKTDRLAELARLLEVRIEWLISGAGEMRSGEAAPFTAPPIAPEIEVPGEAHTLPPMSRMPRDVPVMGTAVGGKLGDFHLNTETPIDHVRRPAGIAAARDVYALYVVSSSMIPRYEEGDLIYVHPHRPPTVGCYVVVQLRDQEHGEHEALIKRLARRSLSKLVLEQFNPPGTREIAMSKVEAIHRILTPNELFGV